MNTKIKKIFGVVVLILTLIFIILSILDIFVIMPAVASALLLIIKIIGAIILLLVACLCWVGMGMVSFQKEEGLQKMWLFLTISILLFIFSKESTAVPIGTFLMVALALYVAELSIRLIRA